MINQSVSHSTFNGFNGHSFVFTEEEKKNNPYENRNEKYGMDSNEPSKYHKKETYSIFLIRNK